MPSSRGENGPCYRVLLSQPWRIRLVPLAGLEPARCFHHLILSQARLPIPPQGLEGGIIAANARGSTARALRSAFWPILRDARLRGAKAGPQDEGRTWGEHRQKSSHALCENGASQGQAMPANTIPNMRVN